MADENGDAGQSPGDGAHAVEPREQQVVPRLVDEREDPDDDEVREMIDHSYDLVVKGLPRAERTRILGQ